MADNPPKTCCGFRVKRLTAALGILTAILCAVLGPRLLADEPYKPLTLLAPQPIIVDAPTRRANEIGDDLSPTDLVIGVTVGGESRAYPINMLTGPSREIINDQVGGTAIAATW